MANETTQQQSVAQSSSAPVATSSSTPAVQPETPVELVDPVDSLARAAIIELARIVQNYAQPHGGADSPVFQAALSDVRVQLGDREHETHVLIRNATETAREADELASTAPRKVFEPARARADEAMDELQANPAALAKYNEILKSRERR